MSVAGYAIAGMIALAILTMVITQSIAVRKHLEDLRKWDREREEREG